MGEGCWQKIRAARTNVLNMTHHTIRTKIEAPLGWIVIDRPEKFNAFTEEMWGSLIEAVRALEATPEVRVVMIRGAGEKAFSAGADLVGIGQRTEANQSVAVSAFDAFIAVERCTKPTIAMIHGVCMGGGCGLALAADLRVASDDARFAITPARVGLGYAFSGVERVVRELGPASARYLFLTAGEIDAAAALRTGLVHEIHPSAVLETASVALATRIANNAPKTARLLRESIRQAVLPEMERRLDLVRELFDACIASDDLHEGLAAFREKRRAQFRDR